MIKSTLCYIERDGRYLMMFRGKKDDDPNAGKWIGVGGKFLEGESPDECMLREVREETGLVLQDHHFHGVIRFRSDTWEAEDMYLYSAKVPTGAAVDFDGCEEGLLQWVDKRDVLSLPLWSGDRLFLEKLMAGEKRIELTLYYKGEEEMEINKDTKLLDILDQYPWLREELPKKDSRFKLLDSALGRVFLKNATIGDLSKKADIPAETLLEELDAMLEEHAAKQ